MAYSRKEIELTHKDYNENVNRWEYFIRSYNGGFDYMVGQYLNRYYLELDNELERIIFIDQFNKVISINYGKPFSKKIISSKVKAIAVIEIPYNCSKKLQIKKGDEIRWSKINKNKKKNIRYYHCLD